MDQALYKFLNLITYLLTYLLTYLNFTLITTKLWLKEGTQSNWIYGLGSMEFGNRTKPNTKLCLSSISEPIELNRTNRIQSNPIH